MYVAKVYKYKEPNNIFSSYSYKQHVRLFNHFCSVINGNWGPWGESPCSQDFCKGTLNKARECNNPPPANGGSPCSTSDGGTTDDNVPCNQDMDNCAGISFNMACDYCSSGTISVNLCEIIAIDDTFGTKWVGFALYLSLCFLEVH